MTTFDLKSFRKSAQNAVQSVSKAGIRTVSGTVETAVGRLQQSARRPSATRRNVPLGTATVTASALNVRSGAGMNYPRIGGLVKGQSVPYYEEKDGWLRIAYGTKIGWVSAQYTTYTPSTDPGTTEPTEPTEPGTTEPSFTAFDVRVTASDGLNVRTGPGASNTKIGALTAGTVVTVQGEQDGWYKIDYNGSTGWICAEYTEKVDGGSTGGGESETTKKVTTTTALNLRDKPGNGSSAASGSQVLVTMPAGTMLEVQAEQDGWYKVTYNGITGWCCADYTAPYVEYTGSGKPADAVALAQKYLGKTTKDLVGVLPYLTDLSPYAGTNNGYDLNCANFVSAILQNCSLLGTHVINCSSLRSACTSFGYRIVSKASAKPGDVWISSGHTEIVETNNGGKITMIGSNNGGDDVQEVSRDSWSAQNVDADIYSLQ